MTVAKKFTINCDHQNASRNRVFLAYVMISVNDFSRARIGRKTHCWWQIYVLKKTFFHHSIVVWSFKTRWDAVRPFSAIPFAMKDQLVPSYIQSSRTFGQGYIF